MWAEIVSNDSNNEWLGWNAKAEEIGEYQGKIRSQLTQIEIFRFSLVLSHVSVSFKVNSPHVRLNPHLFYLPASPAHLHLCLIYNCSSLLGALTSVVCSTGPKAMIREEREGGGYSEEVTAAVKVGGWGFARHVLHYTLAEPQAATNPLKWPKWRDLNTHRHRHLKLKDWIKAPEHCQYWKLYGNVWMLWKTNSRQINVKYFFFFFSHFFKILDMSEEKVILENNRQN